MFAEIVKGHCIAAEIGVIFTENNTFLCSLYRVSGNDRSKVIDVNGVSDLVCDPIVIIAEVIGIKPVGNSAAVNAVVLSFVVIYSNALSMFSNVLRIQFSCLPENPFEVPVMLNLPSSVLTSFRSESLGLLTSAIG